MKLFIILLLSSYIFAELNKQAICLNKCEQLSEQNCTYNEYQNKCELITSKCETKFDCSLNETQAKCTNFSDICKWSDSLCQTKNELNIFCSSKNKTDCDKETEKCNLVNTFSTCTYKTGQCRTITSELNCNLKYCNSDFSCEANLRGGCSAQTTVTSCDTTKGCLWGSSANACTDDCAQYKTSTECSAQSTRCKAKTLFFTCSDNPTTGTVSCTTTSSELACDSTFCTKIMADICTQKLTYCSSMNPIQCESNTDYCSLSLNPNPKCENKMPLPDCQTITTQLDCQNKIGCFWTHPKCKNIIKNGCSSTDSQSECDDENKFCIYQHIFMLENNQNLTSYINIINTSFLIMAIIFLS